MICANTGLRLSMQPLLSHKPPLVWFVTWSVSGQTDCRTRTILTNVLPRSSVAISSIGGMISLYSSCWWRYHSFHTQKQYLVSDYVFCGMAPIRVVAKSSSFLAGPNLCLAEEKRLLASIHGRFTSGYMLARVCISSSSSSSSKRRDLVGVKWWKWLVAWRFLGRFLLWFILVCSYCSV